MQIPLSNVLIIVLLAPMLASCATTTTTNTQTNWTRFSDPFEKAFTLEVPAGWKVQGGLYRKGILDPRVMIDVASPDGRITYRFGDAGIPPFTVPTPMMMQLGFREGSPYNPGGRVQGMIAHYRNGAQFANLYAQTHYGPICRNIAIKSMRMADPVIRIDVHGNDNAGEVVFTCEGSAGPMVGYVYAQSSGSARAGLWGIPVLHTFLAPQAEARKAMELVAHGVRSYRENPQWTQYQIALCQRANGQIAQEFQAGINNARAQAQMADQQLDSIRRQGQRADSQLKLSEDFNDIINGVTLTRDPTTGQTREVASSQRPYHWADAAGNTRSTATYNQPGPNYHPLQTINRGQQ